MGRGAHRFSFDQGSRNTENGYEENANGIVVVLVQRPKDETRNLEDIEGMKRLQLIRTKGAAGHSIKTYFVYK